MGRNTLEEVIKHRSEILLEVFVSISEGAMQRKDALLEKIQKLGIPLQYVSKNKLLSLVSSESHQGFVARIKERNFLDLKTFLKKEREKSFVLMLDNIVDPHNMGAIFRSAECFNVDAIIYSKNRGADITPVVSKVSCGATELVPILRISNLSQTAQEFQKNDYQIVIAENNEKAVNISDFSFPLKTLLIMGSEAEGVQRLLKEISDMSIKIPLFGKIDSLNVAQATAVILAFMRIIS